VAQHGDLYVLGIRRWTKSSETEELSNDHESQAAYYHRLILPDRHHPLSLAWR